MTELTDAAESDLLNVGPRIAANATLALALAHEHSLTNRLAGDCCTA